MTIKRWIICALSIITLSHQLSLAQEKREFPNVTEYLDSIVYNPTDTIIKKVCILIDSVDDKDIQSSIAGIAYDYFSQSPIMGQEAVAVYIADNYFLNKKLKWSDEETYPLLYAFAEFNRQSLIGMDAPDLELYDIDGNPIDIRKTDSDFKILYFYDTQCSSCARQTPELTELLHQYNGTPLTLFAIYTQGNREEWSDYVSKSFDTIDNDKVTVINLWDPEVESDFQRKYSVLTTPSMLLLDRNNTIIGRRLESESLSQILNIQNTTISEYRKLFDQIFMEFDPNDTSIVLQVADAFERRVGNDSTLFRETFLELFKYFKDKNSTVAAAIATNYIIDKQEYWSKEIIEDITEALSLYSMNPVGSIAPDLVLADSRGKLWSTNRIKSRYTLLFFHLITCDDCQKELSILERNKKLLNKKGVKVISIYVGYDTSLWNSFCNSNKKWLYLRDNSTQSDLYKKYDISIVPKLYLLDSQKTIIAKNISANELIKLISE